MDDASLAAMMTPPDSRPALTGLMRQRRNWAYLAWKGPALLGLALFGACYTPPPLDSGQALRSYRKGAGSAASSSVPSSAENHGALQEEAAVAVAVKAAPSVETARANTEEARGNAVRTRAFDNPELRVDNGFLQHGSNNQDRDVYKLGLSVRFPLPSPAERPAAIDAADAAVRVSETRERVEETQARHDIRLAYARGAAAKAKAALLARLTEARKAREVTLAAAVQGGHGVAMDLAQVRVAISEAMDAESRAEEDLADALASLARVLGNASPTPDALPLDALPVCHRPPTVELTQLEERAVTASPTLEHLRATHRQAEEAALVEHKARVPRIKYLELGYTHNSLLGGMPSGAVQDIEPRYYSWSVHANIGVDLPIWNWNGGKIQSAEAKVNEETARFQGALSTTLAGLRRTLVHWQKAHERAERSTAETIPAAETALKLTRQAVEGMRLPATASLQAEEKLIAAELQRIDDLLQCRIDEIEIEAAVGGHL